MICGIMSKVMDKFEEWLRVNMNVKGWSQADLARASGLTRQTISYYLSGASKKPDADALRLLASAFGLDEVDALRAAGMMSPAVGDSWVDQQAYKLSLITDPTLRETAARLINSLAEQEAAAAKAGLKTKKVSK
jgi:transcriptional regulator with XRE-family HTH domain